MSDISARLRENADLDEMEHCNPDVVALEREAADTIDQLRTRIAELEEALGSIAKRCQESRSQTRRIRWIEQRATAALTGEPFKEHVYQMPKNGERTAEKVWRENVRLKAHIAELEAQQRARVPDVDALAAFIRKVDGSHRMGAGVLAERICDWWASDAVAVSPAPKAQQREQNQNALIRGAAQEAEPRVKHTCNMGVGCEEYGICYAMAHGEPDRCGREQAQPADVGAGGRDELARALTDICDEIDKHTVHTPISATNIAWFKRKAREALAAHRKGGGA